MVAIHLPEALTGQLYKRIAAVNGFVTAGTRQSIGSLFAEHRFAALKAESWKPKAKPIAFKTLFFIVGFIAILILNYVCISGTLGKQGG